MLKYPTKAILLAMIYQQITSSAIMPLQMTEKLTKSYLIVLEGYWHNSERVFGNKDIICEKYYICIISNNVN
jgi:hypothetical protein